MAKGIQNYPNISAADAAHPDGNIKDNPGDGTGTPFNKVTYQDMHQVFAKLLRLAAIVPNNLEENETNGFQYIAAMKQLFRVYPLFTSYTGAVNPHPASATTQQVIVVAPGTAGGKTIRLPNIIDAATDDILTIKVVNDSGFSIDVAPNPTGANNINYVAANYAVGAGTIREFTGVKALVGWIVTDK